MTHRHPLWFGLCLCRVVIALFVIRDRQPNAISDAKRDRYLERGVGFVALLFNVCLRQVGTHHNDWDSRLVS